MANALLGTKNRASSATFAGGSWSASLPLANLATTDITQVARTNSAALANTRFRMDLGANYTLRCFGLINHSLSTAGLWRVRVGSAGLDVDFTSGMQGDDRLTITGPTNALHVGSTGLLVAGSGGARLVYDPVTLAALGVLLESASTNLWTWSQDMSNAAWTKNGGTTVTANAITAPDGTTTSDLITHAAAGEYFGRAVTFSAGSTITVSWDVAPGSTTWCRAEFGNSFSIWYNASGSGSIGTVQNGSGNIVRAAHGIERSPNGHYRCFATIATSTVTTMNVLLWAANGNGNSSITGSSMYLWQLQAEVGGLSSRIPTTSSTVTRTADAVAALTGATFTALHSATGGTFYAEITPVNTTGTDPILSLDDNTANEQIRLYTSSTDPKFTVTDGGATQADLDMGTVAAGTTYKLAASWAANAFAACLNGGTVAADTAGTVPALNRLRIGADQAGNGPATVLKRITWWASARTNAELQSITTSGPDALGYNSGWIDADRLTWYEGVPTAWGSIYPLLEPFTGAISARYITFEVSDTTNAAGYIDFGRVFVGDALQATYNISYGMSDGLTDLSGRAQSPAGKVYGTSRRPRRTINAALDWLSQAEADRLHEVMLNLNTLGELLWMPDPANADLVQRYGMLCTLQELPQLGYPSFNLRAWQFRLDEVL